jgi:hypothetical protein
LAIDTDLVIYVLVVVDVVLYFMLFQGYQREKRMFRIPKVSTPNEAFAFFERAYRQAFPQDKEGFTWGEAVRKARRLTELNDFQWDAVQKSLNQYEAYRYGGIGEGKEIDTYSIMKLAMLLRLKRYYT